MAAIWIEIGLWLCRILRILLIARCLVSCFTDWESKVYKAFYYVTLPITFIITYPMQRITKKKKLFFDIDALVIYVLILYVNHIIMNAKVVMGLI